MSGSIAPETTFCGTGPMENSGGSVELAIEKEGKRQAAHSEAQMAWCFSSVLSDLVLVCGLEEAKGQEPEYGCPQNHSSGVTESKAHSLSHSRLRDISHGLRLP